MFCPLIYKFYTHNISDYSSDKTKNKGFLQSYQGFLESYNDNPCNADKSSNSPEKANQDISHVSQTPPLTPVTHNKEKQISQAENEGNKKLISKFIYNKTFFCPL